MRVVPLRLKPGDDLRLGCQQQSTTVRGDLEIISLAGTLAAGGAHLHIAIANNTGALMGGHLCAGSLVRTTAELVVGLLPEWEFRRELDSATGYAELQITRRVLE
jgi:predicted DNA-binding protein with PD1-like motif